jgi:phosphoribosylanthranilate isomerase
MKTEDINKSDFKSPHSGGFRGAIKVCGMRDSQNIQEVASLKPDFLGFIFYPKSPRYAATVDKAVLAALPSSIKKVGVFVNESVELMRQTAQEFGLDALQLHGVETPLQCLQLREEGYTILKAFSIAEEANFEIIEDYDDCCDYFLFDTKTPQHGGSGQKFDWILLENYKGTTPFFLSGGIDLDDAEAIKNINHPQFVGVDINSRFEIESALKDVGKITQFISKLAN